MCGQFEEGGKLPFKEGPGGKQASITASPQQEPLQCFVNITNVNRWVITVVTKETTL